MNLTKKNVASVMRTSYDKLVLLHDYFRGQEKHSRPVREAILLNLSHLTTILARYIAVFIPEETTSEKELKHILISQGVVTESEATLCVEIIYFALFRKERTESTPGHTPEKPGIDLDVEENIFVDRFHDYRLFFENFIRGLEAQVEQEELLEKVTVRE